VSDRENTRSTGNELTLGVLVAIIGFVGVLAGGFVTYVTNQSLLDRQIQNSERLDLRSAKIAATIEQVRLTSLRVALQERIRYKSVAELSPTTTRSRLGTAELAIMLVHLDPSRRRAYSGSEYCVSDASRLMKQLIRHVRMGMEGADLKQDTLSEFRRDERCIDAGAVALRPLAGT